MLVNGASIRFRTRCRIELVSRARFLFGKQILEIQDDSTDMERLYGAIQTLYVGPPAEAGQALVTMRTVLERIRTDPSPDMARLCATLDPLLQGDELYAALRVLRGAIASARAHGRLD